MKSNPFRPAQSGAQSSFRAPIVLLVTACLGLVLWISFGFARLLMPVTNEALALREVDEEDAPSASRPGGPLGEPATSHPGRRSELISDPDGWPNFLGPRFDGSSGDRGIVTEWPAASPPVKWRRSVGSGYSAPIVRDDTLMLFHRLDDWEIVECLDAETGATRWTYRCPTTYRCSVGYSSGPYATPAMDARHVYAWGAEGKFHCLDRHSGTKVWMRSLNDEYGVKLDEFYPVCSSPLLEDDRIILNVGGRQSRAGIVALDKATGRTLWQATSEGRSYATPVAATIHGRRHVFVFARDGLVSIDPGTGRVDWEFPFRARSPEVINATSPITMRDLVFVTGYQAGCLCVRVLPGGGCEEVYRNTQKVLDCQYNNLVCADGYVFGFASIDGSFRCIHMETGRVRWKWKSKIGRGTSITVDGRIILFGEKGHLASLEISTDKPTLRAMTGRGLLAAPCYTAPALSRGLLYLRNEDTLLCLDLRGAMEKKDDHFLKR